VEVVLGQVLLSRGRGSRPETERLYGLSVLRVRTNPEGFWGEYRLTRAGQRLRKGGVSRILAPAGFPHWALFRRLGLFPVEPGPMLRAMGPALAVEALRRQGTAPEQAVVALCAPRADKSLEQTARALCPRVRRLVISAPQGGEELARRLRAEYGIPILPPETPCSLALGFAPQCLREGEPGLELFGQTPALGGLSLSLPGLPEGDRENLSLLTALWETKRFEEKDLKIT
jgi:hypothetical protein